MKLVFDRGTIVIEDPPDVDLSTVPGLTWDGRVGMFRARACDVAAVKAGLVALGCHGIDASRPVPGAGGQWEVPALRPYQESALAAWNQAGRRGLIVLPTGSGKTRTALAAIARSGVAALCVVPTRVLLEQWLAELGRCYRGAIGCLGDGRREVAHVTVATYESAFRYMDAIGNRFELLVVDEAHHFGNGVRDELLEMSIASLRLGLTATPPDGEPAVNLAALVGPTVFELSIGDLAGTYLADFESMTLYLELTPAERTRYERLMGAFTPLFEAFRRRHPDAPWRVFATHASGSDEGLRALAGLRNARRLVGWTHAKRAAVGGLLERHRAAKVLVFTADNATAYTIAREHLIMPLTCDIGRKEREHALAAFRAGELRALVSAQVLNEGMDVPDADVGIIVAGAGSGREHIQRVGRLLRPAPGKKATVYELVMRDTVEVKQARKRRAGLGANQHP